MTDKKIFFQNLAFKSNQPDLVISQKALMKLNICCICIPCHKDDPYSMNMCKDYLKIIRLAKIRLVDLKFIF